MDEAVRKPNFWPLDLITFVLICVSVVAINFALWDAARLSASPEQWSNAEYFFSNGFFGPMFKLLLTISFCITSWIFWVNLGTRRQFRFPWIFADVFGSILLIVAAQRMPPLLPFILIPPVAGWWASSMFGKRHARLIGGTAVLVAAVLCTSALYQIVDRRLVASDASHVANIATQLDAAALAQAVATRDDDPATVSQAANQSQTLTTQLRDDLPADRSRLRSEVLNRHTALITSADRARITIASVQQAGGADPATLTSPEQSAARLADLRTLENTAIAYLNLLETMSSQREPALADSSRPIPAGAVFNREYRPPTAALAAERAHATRIRDIASAKVLAVTVLNRHQGNWQLSPDGAVQFNPTVPAEDVAAYTAAAQRAANYPASLK